jgi:membrane-associated phospholipid phosphatase
VTSAPLAAALRLGLILSLLDPIVSLDWRVQHAVQSARPQLPLEGLMQGATDTGRKERIFGLLLAVAVFTGASGPATARECLLALLPATLTVEGLKRLTDRTRPDGETKSSNSSFPSSHAAGAFALATVFTRRWKRLWPLWFLAAALVAVSRVYLNRHFLSDVVVGAMIGFGWAWALARWVFDRSWKRAPANGG